MSTQDYIEAKPKHKITKKMLSILLVIFLFIIIVQSVSLAKLYFDNRELYQTLAKNQQQVQKLATDLEFFDQRVAFWSPIDNYYHHYDCPHLNKNTLFFSVSVDYAQTANSGLAPCPSCREEAAPHNH